jgi:hypothetical protein
MRNVGKWLLDKSGKYPVNESDEEIFACVRLRRPHRDLICEFQFTAVR